MSKLLQQREQLVYPPQVATTDTSWAYIHSFNLRPFNSQDLDAANYKLSGLGGERGGIGQHQNQGGSIGGGSGKNVKKEPIDRFASLIDTEDPRFEKQRKENYKQWEQGVQNMCSSMNRSIDAFYDRKNEVYHNIVSETISRRDRLAPQVDINETTDDMKELAIAPWIFQSLPGTKPTQQWPQSLASLAERLDKLNPIQLWNEPLDIISGGPEFFEQANAYIKATSERLNSQQEPSEDLVANAALAIGNVFAVSVQMGNNEKIMESLDMINKFQEECKYSDNVFEQSKTRMQKYLKQMQEVLPQQKTLHHLQASSTYGVISIAKYISFVNLNEYYSSITTDGDYIYLYISMAQRGCMYKIGTGEAGTIAGKVYLTVQTDREGEITWVYCQGKLYSRRANEELGQITVIDPNTLKVEAMAKLFVGEAFLTPAAQSINRYYPLLTDGNNLFAVTMNIVKKRRRVKDSMRKQYQNFQEEKKKKKEELLQATKDATEKVKEDQKVSKKEERKKKREEREKNKDKDSSQQQQERKIKELMKQQQKLQKAEILKKAQEMKMKEPAAPGEEGKEALLQPPQEPDQYKVCEFYLHEFDVQNQNDEEMTIPELLLIPEVVEMFESFSGFFSYQECYKALKFNGNDVAEAAAWLVDEGEKERGKKSFIKKRSVLLAESEILSENQTKKHEIDIVVKPDSLLYPTNITSGKWTINGDYISFHSLVTDNGYIKVFSTKEQDTRVINMKEEKKNTQSESSQPPLPDLKKENEEEVKEEKIEVVETESLVESVATESVIEEIKEDDMFEEIKLQGTFVKNIKLQRNLDYNHNTYLIYDHTYKKFYFMLIASNNRYIAVAHDFQSMGKLLSEFDPTETNGNQIDQAIGSELKDFNDLARQTFQAMIEINKNRFNMPWRWRPWSAVYGQVLQQWEQFQFDQNDADANNRGLQEQRKKQLNKLIVRFEKAEIREQQLDRELYSIQYDEKAYLKRQKKYQDKKIAEKKALEEEKKKKITKAAELSQGGVWGGFNSPGDPPKYLGEKSYGGGGGGSSDRDLVLPQENIFMQKEVKKLYAYCVSGNDRSLEILFKMIKQNQSKNNNGDMQQLLLKYLLDWVIYADILINQQQPKIVDDIYYYLIDQLKLQTDSAIDKNTIWRILIIGWPIFATCTEKQLELINLIIDYSLNEQSPQLNHIPQDKNGGDTQINTNEEQLLPQSKEGNKMNYYIKLLRQDMTPIQLFYLRFFHYHASFYPFEILNQSKVVSSIILIDKNSNPSEDLSKEKPVNQSQQFFMESQRYTKFKQFSNPFMYYKPHDISLVECKDYVEKEVDCGVINHNFFSVPIYLMFTEQFELIEDFESIKDTINLDQSRKIYTDAKFEISQPLEDQKEIHQLKLQDLYKLRDNHKIKSHELLQKFKQIIKKCIKNDSWDASVHPFILMTFNNLARLSLAQIEWNKSKYCKSALDFIKFVEESLSLLQKKSNNFKLQSKPFVLEWIWQIYELLTIVLSMSYKVVDYDTYPYFAKESLSSLIKIMEIIKQVFIINKDDQKSDILLEKAFVFQSEGTDFTYEKTFETQHPYPRGEYQLKDSISVSKAIAFSIELDKRCSTEFNSDYLVIQSQDHAFWVNDTFGTHMRFYGKPNVKYPVMILGSKINIEFKSYPHGKKGGGGPGGPGQPASEDTNLRWGFRLIIRPIYGEPQYIIAATINKELQQQVFRRIGGDDQIKALVSILNNLVYITSKFSRSVTSSDIALVSENGQALSQDITENLQKFSTWHLFKGGIRTNIIHQLHNPKVLEQIFHEAHEIERQKHEDKIQSLEVFKAIEAQEEKKPQSSTLIVEGDKVKVQEDFKPDQSFWTGDIQKLINDREFLEAVNKKIRELVPYSILYLNEKKKPSFKKDFQEEWLNVEYMLILAMLFHSNSIEATQKFLKSQKGGSPNQQNLKIEENLKLIGSQVNDVLGWMQSRLQGEQDFQIMVRDIISQSQTYITKFIAKKLEEEAQKKLKQQEEEEERKKQELLKQEEEKKKKEEEEKKEVKPEGQEKKKVTVSKDTKVNKVKRKKVVKMSQADVKIKKDKKNQKKQKDKEGPKEEIKEQEKEVKPEDQKVEEKKDENQTEKIKYLELQKSEENEIKNKIYNKVYEEFLQFYQGNQDRVKPLCLLLNIKFNPEDPNESLKAIFKRVKNKLRVLIDFDGDLPIREHLDIDELKLESPYKEISKEVKARLLFLFELNPSIDYYSKVINVDINQLRKRAQISSIGVNQERMDDDDSSQHNILTESSMNGDDDEVLEPLGVQRSQSALVPIQSSVSGMQGVSQAVIFQQNQMNQEDIANWIDNYRKWRQWNHQHKLIHKGQQIGLELLDEDLTSPFCSPLYSVVVFAKSSKVLQPEQLRQILINQQVNAGFRLFGMQIQEKLLQITWNSPFYRLIWGNISQTLHESVFYQIESCGETLAQTMNENSRVLISQLMQNVINCRKNIDKIIKKRQQYSYVLEQGRDPKYPNSQQTLSSTEKQKQQHLKSQLSIEELLYYEYNKKLVNTLNDIRVLLNNLYTLEYVLESIKQGQKQLQEINLRQDNDQLTIETIREFLKAIVSLMLQFTSGAQSQIFAKSSPQLSPKLQFSPKMQFSITHCCKLILNQFLTDKSMMRSEITQKVLQEMLLDIIVSFLEKHCELNKMVNDDKNQKRLKLKLDAYVNARQDQMIQLLKLLSEVIRISNDHQQHLLSLQHIQSGQTSHSEQFFLSEDSDKVMRCAQILSFMIHNIEVPAVIRQTIKCARLFFKLVDFKKLKIHHSLKNPEDSIYMKVSQNEFLLETLKKIGSKISNSKEAEKQEEKSSLEDPQPTDSQFESKDTNQVSSDDKLYVVYANINSSDEDFSFLITALYHWEEKYPSFTLELPKDPNEIVVKTKPKEEVKKEGEEPDPSKLQLQEQESNVDLQELINIQKQQQLLQNSGRGGFRGGRGGAGGPGRGGKPYVYYDRQPSQIEQAIKRQPNPYYQSYSAFKQSQLDSKQPPAGLSFNSIYQGYQPGIFPGLQSIGITKLDQLYDEVIKNSWEDCKEEDTSEEKQRKLNEKNYNTRIQTHIKDAIQLAVMLNTRYSAPMTEPLPFKKALEFSNLLQKAYKGQLETIQVNPHMKPEAKEKKLANQKTIAQNFPLLLKTIEQPKKAKDLPPGSGAPIMIAPKRLILSLAEKRIHIKYEQSLEEKASVLKVLEKKPNEIFNCNVIHQGLRRQGASISIIIQEFIQLIRSLIRQPKLPSFSNEGSSMGELSLTRQMSRVKVQQQQEVFFKEIIEIINFTMEQLAQKQWKDFNTTEKQVILGILAVLGGWHSPIRTGQPVQVEINNQWVDAIIVDDGLGKKRISVILEDDDSLQLQKVPIQKIRPSSKYDWSFDGNNISQHIDQEKLCTALINIYEQVKVNSPVKVAEDQESQILSENFTLLMLLKVSSQIKWQFMDKNNETFKKFMVILTQITKDMQSEEDKTKKYWEKALIDSWERLIDKDEKKNHDFFVLRENFLQDSQEPNKDNKEEIKAAEPKLEQKKSAFNTDLQYQDNDFVQPLSSYLKGLPEPIPKKNSSEAALKLLAYWEKNIIPKIIEFVRTTYKPWEMEFYFEQLRHHLRHGDQQKALDDALTMCERKMPQGCQVPDDNYDWTAKMVDECIVDSWALAKFKSQRHHQSQQQQNQQNQSNSQSGETSYPLLNKLINYGIDEIVILIKAVDMRTNVVLAEYQDPDSMQVHSLWLPCSFLNDLHNPLPPRAVGYTTKTLKNSFEYSVSKIDSIYARQTLIQFFHAFQEHAEKQIISLPSSEMRLQEIISWSVWEEFNSSPVLGWMKDLSSAITSSNSQSKLNESTITAATQISTQVDQNQTLQEFVEESSEQIVLESLLNSSITSNQTQQQSTLTLIQNMFKKCINNIDEANNDSLKTEDAKIVSDIVDWCIENWYKISENIRSNRAVFDLCQEHENFVSNQGKHLDENIGQLLPLHELIQKGEVQSSAIGTLLMFKKSGAHLTPTSKIQFFSDQNKVNLVSEISAGSEGKRDLPPLLLNHGTIWVHFDQGTTALLPKHQQSDQKSSLPCALIQIPNSWSVCCWLTETITNVLLQNPKINTNFSIDIFSKLIGALTVFYEDAKAPSMLKSIIFNLLSRLIIKLRTVYYQKQEETNQQVKDHLSKHLERLFINKEFISTLLSEVLIHKESEEQALLNQGGHSILYPAFVQDCIELILTILVPTAKNIKIESYKELISGSGLEIPDWLQPLIKASYFMHYFSGQMPLSLDILKEIHAETKLNHSQLDQIIVVQNLPVSEKYTREWIKEQVIKLIVDYGARILNPATDIIFTNENSIVILVDGIDHMSFVRDEEKLQDKQGIEESESEEDEEEEGEGAPKKVEVEKEEEVLMPSSYNCPACTLENPIDVSACDICATPKPPMELIIAEFQAKLNIGKPEEPVKPEGEGQEAQQKSATLIKLESLAKQISRIISRDEKRIIREEKQKKEEEEKARKEEEEKKKKEEEEQKKKEQEEKAKKDKEDKKKKDKSPPNNKQKGKNMEEVKQQILQIESESSLHYFGEEDEDSDSSVKPDKNAEKRRKFIEMGIDPEILDQEPDLARALEASLLEQEEQQRAAEEKKLKEEEEKKKKERDEEEKKRRKEQEEKDLAEGKTKPKFTKLKVLVGKDKVFDDIESSKAIYKVLRDRIQDPANLNSIDLQVSQRVQLILQQIHENFQTLPLGDLTLPQDQLFEDFDFTKESIKDSPFEEFMTKCILLIEANVKLFMMLLESQGYDFWFEKVAYPTYIPESKLQQHHTSSQQHMINVQILEKLKTFIEIEMCKESKGVLMLHPSSLRLISKISPASLSEKEKPINYYDDELVGANYPEINEKMTIADVRYQWALLKTFNKYLAPTVPYINTSQSISDIPHNTIPMRLSVYMSYTRNLCLLNVKFDLRHLILEKTSVNREHAPRLFFERLKLAHKNRENEENGDDVANKRSSDNAVQEGTRKEKRQQEFMYVQAFEQIKEMDLALLRPKKPQGAEPHLSFHIWFKGEHVVGEGGPYRQFFADISSELQPLNLNNSNVNQKLLNLIYPTPNNRAGINFGKEKMTLSPSKNSSQDLSLYEFLGILMGVCIRTGAHLNLDLAQFVWKQLSGQKVSYEDLIEIDVGFWKLLSCMLTANQKLYDESIFENWVITMSDESQVELKENGRELRVLYEERLEFIKTALYTRLKECQLQCEAIKRGIAKIVPEALLNMVTYSELETWVCGKSIVDIDLLKRHTKYGGDKKTTMLNEESRRVKWFWEVLRDFSEEDKQRFIKFCWGQQRLPANDEEFDRRQVRFMIKPAMKSAHGDGALPKADTCFFNLELPDYTSKEIMRQRILLAIHTDCDSMNAEAEHVNLNQDQMGQDADHSYDEEY